MNKFACYGTSRFNPRSRVGSDIDDNITAAILVVSIHAPAWGATFLARLYSFVQLVSIHAPAWGATEPLCCFLLD